MIKTAGNIEVSTPKKAAADEQKVSKMVEDTKRFAKGEVLTAEQIVQEVKKEDNPEKAADGTEDVQKLAQELMKKGTLRK